MCYKFGPRCPKSALSALRSAKKAASKAVTTEEQNAAADRVAAATFEYYCTTEGLDFLEKKIEAKPEDAAYYQGQLEQARASREFRIALANNKEEEHLAPEEEVKANRQHDASAMGAKERRAAGLQITINKEDGVPDGAYLDSIASVEDFEKAYQDRLIEATPHPDPNVPYVVLDYSREAQFKNEWNDITVNARGLIINRETGEIVARPFRKFFNYNQPVPGLTDFDRSGPVVVTNKEDGSMGTLYALPDGTPSISTRGSMNSDQAHRATEMFRERYAGKWEQDPNRTYVYEIIYPENRIVLDYGDKEELILIGAIDKRTGRSVPLNEVTEWKGERAEQYSYGSYAEALSNPIPDDREGVVVHFVNNDERVKIKGATYMDIHRKISNITGKRLWQQASNGESEEWLYDLPDEFAAPATEYITNLRTEFSARMNKAEGLAQSVALKHGITFGAEHTPETKKRLAQDIMKNYSKAEFSKIMLLVEGKREKLEASIWKEIEPVGKVVIVPNLGDE